MSPELETNLITKYHKIFSSSHCSIGFFIECEDGWFNIIDRMLSSIQEHVESSRNQRARDLRYNRALKAGLAGKPEYLYNYFQFGVKTYKVDPWVVDRANRDIRNATFRPLKECVQQVRADQIKEKFGTLRFYYQGGDDYIAGIVSLAESISNVTCERCGGPGKKTRSGWIKVLCETCKAK